MDRFNRLLKKFDLEEPPFKSSTRFQVLIIDDSLNIQNALKRILIQKNYEVTLESTGKGGIDALSDETGVVILDVKLPKMDGIHIYIKLKEKNPQVPIIFYSAYPGDKKIVKKCISLKPHAFIEKGVAKDIDSLYQSIDNATDIDKCHTKIN
ncbi:MAG: response regulator [Desulfobacula sp.]|jgi:DNA-binding NtrC family response regulator|nr:response regulator [Desulfobacula sp.]MBT6340870.1 response regulator [Desulfobacula sp.]